MHFSDIVYIDVILHRHQLELNAINLVQDISEVLSRLDFGIS